MSRDSELANIRDEMNAVRQLRNRRLQDAATALSNGQPERAETLLDKHLARHPGDFDGLHLKAEMAVRAGRYDIAEPLLARCVELAPDSEAICFNYANALHRVAKSEAALEQLERLLAKDSHNPIFRDLQAAALVAMGRHEEGANIRRELVADYPDSAKSWLSLGLSLRSVGLSEECVTAFRRAAALNPALGEAWWALANLKTFRLSPHDIEQMQGQLADPALLADNRIYFHYALGKAFADDERWDKSFENYAKANALARIGGAYDADQTAARLERFGKTFTADFFGGRAEWGNSAADPIFIVGMQRSGSTLVEQILASHSAVEALGELPNIALVARQLHGPAEPDYFNAIGNLTADAARRMGEEYLAATCDRRTRGRPFFTDKQPYNFWHAGLIRLMLPNARVIDVRRHPMACCVSNFTQHYATRSTQFTHRLADMGHYYRCYAELMAHLNAAQPGTIHTVIYERLIAEPEKEIRRLLDYLGLPFEPSCLRFHETGRNLDSVSSEQVRQPIYADAVALWRNYEPWLQPLKTALGPVLDSWLTVS